MKLTSKEKEEIFYNSLCNAEGMGYLNSYGVEMSYEPAQYAAAKKALQEAGKDTCYEDILMEILKRGSSLTYIDIVGEGEMTSTIMMNNVYERIDNVPKTIIGNFLSENDDVVDADAVLQTVFWNEVIFG